MSESAPLDATDELSEEVLRTCLRDFSHVRLRVTGECMRPALRAGDVVLVTRRRPRWGDVVLCRHPAGFRLHRLVLGPPLCPPGSSWRTQGDAAPLWDPALLPQGVLGTVVHVEGAGPSRRRWTALRLLLRGLLTRLGRVPLPRAA
jgi:hypothetical protein